ncbi:hypothetical protein PSPO01_07500 [Paraphaeosphaeria sporulosa]
MRAMAPALPVFRTFTTSSLPAHDRHRNNVLTPPPVLQDSHCSIASAATSLCRNAAHSILIYPSQCTGNSESQWHMLLPLHHRPAELHAESSSGYHPVDPKIRFETIGQSEVQLWSAMARFAYTYTPFLAPTSHDRRRHYLLGYCAVTHVPEFTDGVPIASCI